MTLKIGDIVRGNSGKHYEVATDEKDNLCCVHCCFGYTKRGKTGPACNTLLLEEFSFASCNFVLPISAYFVKLEGGI